MTRYPTATTEAEVLKACLDLLRLRGVTAYRANCGAMKQGGRFVRFGTPGQSDICGILPGGRALYVEVKRPKGGKVSDAQRAFLGNARAAGAVAVVVRDVVELARILAILEARPDAVFEVEAVKVKGGRKTS